MSSATIDATVLSVTGMAETARHLIQAAVRIPMTHWARPIRQPLPQRVMRIGSRSSDVPPHHPCSPENCQTNDCLGDCCSRYTCPAYCGDCDDGSECTGSLRCSQSFDNLQGQYGYPASVDGGYEVCIPPTEEPATDP